MLPVQGPDFEKHPLGTLTHSANMAQYAWGLLRALERQSTPESPHTPRVCGPIRFRQWPHTNTYIDGHQVDTSVMERIQQGWGAI